MCCCNAERLGELCLGAGEVNLVVLRRAAVDNRLADVLAKESIGQAGVNVGTCGERTRVERCPEHFLHPFEA